jgi:hypothetical protein
MMGGQVKSGVDGALRSAVAHQTAIAPAAKSKREGINEDRLSRACLARKNRQAGAELEIQSVDEDNVADREPDEHAVSRWSSRAQAAFERR